MKRRLLLAALVASFLAMRSLAGGVGKAAASDAPPAGPATMPAPRPATVGGGVYHPWTPPYMVALINTHEPTSFAMISLSAGMLLLHRHGQKRARARARG